MPVLSVGPLVLAWSGNNTHPDMARGIAMASCVCIGTIGAVSIRAAPAFLAEQARRWLRPGLSFRLSLLLTTMLRTSSK